MAAPAREITFLYRNWRGEIAMRRVVPLSISFGTTDWHPDPQWLLTAEDIDKGRAIRNFALRDCIFATDLAEARTRVAVREALESQFGGPLHVWMDPDRPEDGWSAGISGDGHDVAYLRSDLAAAMTRDAVREALGEAAGAAEGTVSPGAAACAVFNRVHAMLARLDAAPSAQPEGDADV